MDELEEILQHTKLSRIKEAISEFSDKDENINGGNLHIILEDGNVKDSDVEYCIKVCMEKRDWDGLSLAAQLMTITPLQRDIVTSNTPL